MQLRPRRPLSPALLETLSIIAFKQPVTKAVIEEIRGVNSDHGVNKLLEYGLITEKGRLDAPGRPILFITSEDFLMFYGLRSLEELRSHHA
jgi:segregation and condensation protein B